MKLEHTDHTNNPLFNHSYGDKTFKIADEGAAMITVDSGLASYSYIIPAQTK